MLTENTNNNNTLLAGTHFRSTVDHGGIEMVTLEEIAFCLVYHSGLTLDEKLNFLACPV